VLAAIGHRVAIGGLEHSGPAIVDGALLEKLRELVPLAPLHQPRNLEPIETLRRSHPHVSQVACFDTAFHRTLPQEAQLYGLPRELTEAGARRYGFHGLSYEYIATALPALDEAAAEGRTIVCHLGSGASLCALRAGRSVATTMGFSPLSGVVMATRPGDLDAGLMIWLMRERGLTIDTVEHMLYHDAGLKGVSGISGDMRELLASTDPRAAEAISLFVYRVVAEIGRLTAALGGLDALVFTAGIGEHSSDIRGAVCKQCAWLGLQLDAGKNSSNVPRISTPDSAITVLIVPTDEERMVAQHAAAMVAGRSRTEEAT
jgi:acetate kinase